MLAIRPARPADLSRLAAVEDSGVAAFEELYGDLAGDPLSSPARSGAERAAEPGFLLVAGEPVVGFVHVLEVEGHAHLEQVSVLPSQGRRGLGAALVRAAMAEAQRRGHDALTLCTYADVAWNGPFYARLGFEEVEATGHLGAIREAEQRLGLDRHGRRTVMRVALPPTAPGVAHDTSGG